MSLDALHKGLILADRDKYLISSWNKQWLREGCTHPSTQRPLLGLFMVEWGNNLTPLGLISRQTYLA